jgi:putative drug exporter of the RND superfamily
LTAEDQAAIEGIAEDLNTESYKNLGTATATPPSPDGTVQAVFVSLKPDKQGFDPAAIEDAKALRSDLEPLVEGTGLRAGVTGPAAQSADQQESGDQTLLIIGVATIVLIVVLLALIFRSVLACLMPILTVLLAGTVATGLIGWANEIFDLKADSSIEVILFVVLYGIGTDYILFFLFRYREALRLGHTSRESVAFSVGRAGEAIASAAGAVIVAFMALVLSSLGMFRTIGPALAIAVGVTAVAALTLVPAFVSLIGNRALAWPSKSWTREPKVTRFRAIGERIGARPARHAIASGGLLAVLAVFAFAFQPTFDFTSGSDVESESSSALERLEEATSAGAADPASVLVRSTDGSRLDDAALAAYADELSNAEGVEQATLADRTDEVAVVSVILTEDPLSEEALANVKGPIRDAAHDAAPAGTEAFVGGTTSIFADFEKAMTRDYSIVFPVAAAIIFLILALLLRSLVAPLYLMASVGLGFAASLGATVIMFQFILGEPGLIFMLPIYIYLFVVALGTDYNILMVARLREEAREGLEPHPAAAKAVEHAGPTIAAAGVILAGTFASLMLAPDSLTRSMGFSLSIGIALAAFVMALFLTPALTAWIGHAAWWPGHGDEAKQPKEPVTVEQ